MAEGPQAEAATDPATPITPGQKPAEHWHRRIKDYRTAIEEKWQTQCDNLDKLYSRDERADSADREYSIFWANIEVLKPASYARTPVPVVAPRFKGKTNPVAAAASETLERCLVTTFDHYDLDGCMREVRDEFLRYGRGTARARLAQKPDGANCVEFDHFTASDFAHDPARTWREVKWLAFRAWLNGEDGEKRFGEVFKDVPRKKRDPNAAVNNSEDKSPVWEIWDRTSGQVYFVNEDYPDILDTQAPWLDLTSFWPAPKPAFGTLVPKKLKPVPSIRHYKDQIEEINEYTARIAALSDHLRLKGFYPAGAGELSEAIETAMKSLDNRAVLIPVSSYAALGGSSFKDSIVWLPVVDCLNLVKGLVELRRVVIDDVYQITGISDIVRGQTDPDETLGAQQLKSTWGSMRIRESQNELARFARDLTQIAGEIIAENFDPETIREMSQSELPSAQDKAMAQMKVRQMQQQAAMQAQQPAMPGQPPAPPQPPMQIPEEIQEMLKKPSFEDVIKFLKDDRARGFVIEVETDSTIQPDEDAEKQRRIEFVTAIGTMFQQAAPIVMQAPVLGPFMGEVLKFTAAGFRAGRPLEGAIEQLVQQLQAMADQAKQAQNQPQTDPKVEAETEKVKAETEKVRAETDKVRQPEPAAPGPDPIEQEGKALGLAAQKFDFNHKQEMAGLEKAHSRHDLVAKRTESEAADDEADEMVADQGATPNDRRHGESMSAMAEIAKSFQAGMEAIAQAMSAPKRVVRDNSGRVAGVEPMRH